MKKTKKMEKENIKIKYICNRCKSEIFLTLVEKLACDICGHRVLNKVRNGKSINFVAS